MLLMQQPGRILQKQNKGYVNDTKEAHLPFLTPNRNWIQFPQRQLLSVVPARTLAHKRGRGTLLMKRVKMVNKESNEHPKERDELWSSPGTCFTLQ